MILNYRLTPCSSVYPRAIAMIFNKISKDKLMEPCLEMVWTSDIHYRRVVALQYIDHKLLYFRGRMAHLSQQSSLLQDS